MMTTTQRVPMNTADEVNERIYLDIERRLDFYADHPELIDQRLAELDREWDVERMIEIKTPALTLLGMIMGVVRGKRWLLLSAFAQAMMITHGIQGFHPLLPVLRRLGFRTPAEIGIERYALKILRGDFEAARAGEGEGEQKRAPGDAAFEAATTGCQATEVL